MRDRTRPHEIVGGVGAASESGLARYCCWQRQWLTKPAFGRRQSASSASSRQGRPRTIPQLWPSWGSRGEDVLQACSGEADVMAPGRLQRLIAWSACPRSRHERRSVPGTPGFLVPARSARPRSARVPVPMTRGSRLARAQHGPYRFADALQPVRPAHGGEHRGAVGAPAPVRFDQAVLLQAVAQGIQQEELGVACNLSRAELAQRRVVKARIGEGQAERILSVDPSHTAFASSRLNRFSTIAAPQRAQAGPAPRAGHGS